jgi:hypothetical protein
MLRNERRRRRFRVFRSFVLGLLLGAAALFVAALLWTS